ncbi:ComEC/Rec2 family competence protein [Fusobacterium sp. THCT1E2]
MELIYILALEVFIIVTIFNIFSLWISIFLTVLVVTGMYIFFKKKDKFIYVIPVLLVIRILLCIHFNDLERLEIVKMKVEIKNGMGNIIKIDNRYPKIRSYTFIPEIPDGKYMILAEIAKIENRDDMQYFYINKITDEKIEKSWLKNYFENNVKKFVADGSPEFKRVYSAVILGKGKQLTRSMRREFNYVGISHLMALSGLHIGIILGICGFISKKLPVSRKNKYIFMLASLTIYFLGVKHSPSLIRAYIMAVIFIGGKIFYEDIDASKSLAAAFIGGIFISPVAIDEVSFILSYLAVFAIICIYPIIRKIIYRGKSKFVEKLILLTTIQFFLIPILIKEFGTIQFLSFFSNLIILPVGTLYILTSFIGLFLENLGLGFIVFPIVNIIFETFMKLVEIFSKVPYLTLRYDGSKDNALFLIFYVIIFGIVFYNKFKMEGKKNEKISGRTKIFK